MSCSSSLHKAKHSVSRLAASALAPGTHLLPVLLRIPLPSRQPPPCPGKKREDISPAKCSSSGQMPLWRQAGVCHINSRGQDFNQPPNLWRVGWLRSCPATQGMAKKLSTGKKIHLVIWPSHSPSPLQCGPGREKGLLIQ